MHLLLSSEFSRPIHSPQACRLPQRLHRRNQSQTIASGAAHYAFQQQEIPEKPCRRTVFYNESLAPLTSGAPLNHTSMDDVAFGWRGVDKRLQKILG